MIEQIPDGELHELQREMQDALGYHLRVTTPSDYPGRTRAQVASHAISLAPGW
ncbi:hypothetical protein [Cellulomonas sp. WB94]|uniref:hypothetical protein n=1 Tax=Cellulomonas sp. WB94 TaxID=2173174 RepID=UPI0013049AAB|nr:hypothetical protein [Cellulomonas sp. WB94]